MGPHLQRRAEVDRLLHEVADHTLKENALNPLVFPSLREMQRDVVSIAADLFHGGEDVGGAMTSGGTESIFMAVKTARDKARAERGVKRGTLVIPRTAHPAFVKAAHLLDIEYVHVPTREDLRTYAEDMAPLLSDDTVLAVGSAPSYPFGMIDPIPEMAALAWSAESRSTWMRAWAASCCRGWSGWATMWRRGTSGCRA